MFKGSVTHVKPWSRELWLTQSMRRGDRTSETLW